MTQPNLTAVAADGRRWLLDQPEDQLFDIVLVDAYRPPYIPFHLTTVEFFQLARPSTMMPDQGVLMINVGRSPTDFALVDALAATLAAVFPSVLIIDEPGPPDDLGNSLVVAANQPATSEAFTANVTAMLLNTAAPVPSVRAGGGRLRQRVLMRSSICPACARTRSARRTRPFSPTTMPPSNGWCMA